MNDVIASEWLKIRTVRSTYWLLGAVGVALALGCLIASLMVADWDSAPPAEQARFDSADPAVVVLPFVQFSVAVFGALAVASEYGTGMIRGTLTVVPRRLRLLAGKAVVVGGAGLLAGLVLAFSLLAAAALIVGDRPQPIAPWASPSGGIPQALSAGVVIAATGLIGLGLGVVIRSAAGALVTMSALLFVLPVVAFFLPAPWGMRFASVMLPNVPQVAAEEPVKAVVALVCYLAASLGAATWSLCRRDA